MCEQGVCSPTVTACRIDRNDRFLTLAAEEYGHIVKLAACEKREIKFTLLRKIFPGLESINYEKQWDFQYFFSVG